MKCGVRQILHPRRHLDFGLSMLGFATSSSVIVMELQSHERWSHLDPRIVRRKSRFRPTLFCANVFRVNKIIEAKPRHEADRKVVRRSTSDANGTPAGPDKALRCSRTVGDRLPN